MTDQPEQPTTQPTAPSGARGAVDLSGLAQQLAGGPVTTGPDPTAPRVPAGLVVEATDETFQQVMNRTLTVPAVLVLWSSRHAQTKAFADDVAAVAAGFGGRLLVVTADLDTQPGLMQAFSQVLVQAFGQPAIPATFGLIQGQPMPLFPGVQPREQIKAVLEQLLQAAVQNGMTGRVELEDTGEEAELPPLHQEAYDAIERGDLDAAAAAYSTALEADPKDTDAELGLGQVRLLQRTEGADLQTARAAAAERPGDVAAQCLVADLDVLGGHIEDAFLRLVDLVKATSGDEREQAKAHLLDLFTVVGNHDERVKKGRTALMNALF